MMRSRTTQMLLGALLAVTVTAGLVVVAVDRMRAETHAIQPSYMFDPLNMRYMAGYADHVFLGRVADVAAVQPPRTSYDIEIVRSLKGKLGDAAVVSQTGYIDGNDRWVVTDSPLLEPGATYLLMATSEPDTAELTLLGGPNGATALGNGPSAAATDTARDAVDRAQQAIARQVYLPNVPPPAAATTDGQ